MYNKPSLFSPGICYQPSCKLTGCSSDAVRNAAGIILFMKPKMKPRPCCGGLKGQQSYSPRQRLGFLCRVMIASRRGKSIFLPTVRLLPCQGAVCYVTLVPQGVTLGWWLNAPFRGASGS